MTSKYNLTISYFITVLTICSCGNSDNGKNKTFETTASTPGIEQQTESKQALNIGGTYSFGDNVENGPVGSVIVYPTTDNSALFFVDICRGAPSYNLGQLFGKMIIKNNVGTYYSKNDDYNINCLLKFEFNSDQLKVTTGKGCDKCDFGHAVYADNNYKLIDKSIPKYFIVGEGDTIMFKGLTVEKYAKRFE
jgi:hypothetical protein